MYKWLLATAASILVFIGTAQAREYYDPFYYDVEYQGTPNYPENYGDNPPIFDSISDIWFVDFTLVERYPTTIIKNSTMGAEFFYKGRKVGEVQNVQANPFPNILFTDARFFISDPGIVKYSYPECPWDGCGFVTVYAPTDVSFGSVAFTYWNYAANPVPEPETYAMMLSGLAFLGMAGRRKRKA